MDRLAVKGRLGRFVRLNSDEEDLAVFQRRLDEVCQTFIVSRTTCNSDIILIWIMAGWYNYAYRGEYA
jgi:hypothetical protein